MVIIEPKRLSYNKHSMEEQTMKKLLFVTLTLLLCAFCLTACNNDNEPTVDDNPTSDNQNQDNNQNDDNQNDDNQNDDNQNDDVVYSEGLAFTSNGDGTCSVSGIGTCTDTDIVIPPVSPAGDVVTAIGNMAFRTATSITSVTIPDSVTSLGTFKFAFCEKLVRITVDANNQHYKSVDGNIYTKDGKTLVQYAIGKTDVQFVIPDGVTNIDSVAFYGCKSLCNIIIPDSVTSIASYAFYNCESLVDIELHDSLTMIGYSAFDNTAYYNTSANWKNEVLYIGKHLIKAKETISGEYTVKSGTLTIADYAFYGCTAVTSVEIADGVRSIGDYAFDHCSELTGVAIPDSVKSIGDYVFQYCSKLAAITIPYGVTSIGKYAFYQCTGLLNIDIPNTVTIIGDSALQYCTSLANITIPNSVTSIGDSAFYNCKSIINITIPESVKYIGDRAFSWCTALTNITIPDGVTDIGDYMFQYCTSLTNITIPDSVTNIGKAAFYYCEKLADIYYKAGAENFEEITIADSNECLTNATIHYNYGKEVVYSEGLEFTSNGDGTCSVSGIGTCTDSDIVIPPVSPDGDKVTAVGYCAFGGLDTITSITIPDGVISISEEAFLLCSQLVYLSIPKSVTTIGYNAFLLSSKLVSFTVDENNAYFQSIDGNLYSKDGKTLICYAFGKTENTFIIPEGVTNIGIAAFAYCSNIKNIIIPASVTSIDSAAIILCIGLTSITVDSENPNYKSINGNLYTKDGKTLLQYAIGKTDTSFTIPDGVINIDYAAFGGCTNLTSVTIPDSVTNIGYGAFIQCTGLTSITLGNNISTIGAYAFDGCINLTSVTIPDSVTSIGNGAFYGCSSLADVWYKGSEEDWGNISIQSYNECLTNATIHYNYEN